MPKQVLSRLSDDGGTQENIYRAALVWKQSMIINCLMSLLSCLSQSQGIQHRSLVFSYWWFYSRYVLLSLFSPLSLDAIFWSYKKKSLISCCSGRTEKYEAVSWQKTNFSVHHTLLISIHITISQHSEGLWVLSSSLGSSRYLKTKVLSQCKRGLRSKTGFETLGTHPMDSDQDFFLKIMWNFLSH